MFRSQFIRTLATSAKGFRPPSETVPDVETFLNKIGRNMIQHQELFPSWKKLMHASSPEMKSAGVDTRDRRYLLSWIHNFNNGAELKEIKRGTKKWGGERKRKANRAAFYGRKRAEERAAQ